MYRRHVEMIVNTNFIFLTKYTPSEKRENIITVAVILHPFISPTSFRSKKQKIFSVLQQRCKNLKPVQSCATRCSNNVELKIVCRRHVTRIDFLCKKYCIKNCHFAVLHVPLVLSGGFSHTRAARIIYGLTWDTPSQTIQESVK